MFNKFWAYYINELYDVDARKLTCNVKLNPADIQGIQLNDKIFIDGHYYRINKIKGANLINPESVEVELLKTAPRKLNFTGRRRITTPTAGNPNEFVDVIINSFDQQGTLSYQNFETGDIITDAFILEQVSAVDNFDFIEDQIVWNNQPITRTPMSVTVIGNTKYNETQQHILAVGSGNDLSDNVYNTVVFGDNNELYSAGESITIMANDAVITDSNFIALIQPSGSRIISGSSNNVFVNPINDITEIDPTGSVYTGNLINQGTADFKGGAKLTGSVDITGQYLVNGIPISSSFIDTGSFVTTSSFNSFTSSINAYTASNPAPTSFNFAFGSDPTNTIFLSLTGSTGNNRAYNVKYLLTSGSTAINAAQLQVTGDGSTAAAAEVILQRNLGAPTASFIADYTGSTINVRATFVGSSYIMSGSYQSLI